MGAYQHLIVDEPRPLSNALRGELFAALEAADSDDAIRVMITRGAAPWLFPMNQE